MDKYIDGKIYPNIDSIIFKYAEYQEGAKYHPCPQPHPFVDGQDVSGLWWGQAQYHNHTWHNCREDEIIGYQLDGWKTRIVAVPIQSSDLLKEMAVDCFPPPTVPEEKVWTPEKLKGLYEGYSLPEKAKEHNEQTCPYCIKSKKREEKEQGDDWVRVCELITGCVDRLVELRKYHINPYNLGDEGEVSSQITTLSQLVKKLPPQQ